MVRYLTLYWAFLVNRLKILSQVVRPGAEIMVDANEAWGAKEALVKLEAIRRGAV